MNPGGKSLRVRVAAVDVGCSTAILPRVSAIPCWAIACSGEADTVVIAALAGTPVKRTPTSRNKLKGILVGISVREQLRLDYSPILLPSLPR